MLKKTGVKIELFTDMSIHDFIEKAKRDGISKACKRYFKANNPKMGQAFNPSKPTSWISYVDANNLYGWAMSQFLPIGNYQWEASWEYLLKNPAMQKKYLEKILKTKANALRRYFLNIKSHFPLKTHDYLRDLPPAVKNVAVGKDWFSPYNEELVNNLDGGCFSKTEKLVPHLGLRKDYVIHYLKLQYYVKLGMIIDEVSEILSFDQTNWLVPYIAFNTERRQGAKNASEKDFFKLMNNSVHGKTMENERYSDNTQLGYMDTDSFIFQVETEDIYKDMAEHPDLFDLNDTKTIGLFKDETPIRRVWKKWQQTYMPSLEGSLLDDPIDKSSLSEQEAMRADADPMTQVEIIYQDCLFGKEVFHVKNVSFRSKDHILSLVESEKKALCLIDTKRWILSDGITTLPYFHWCNMIYKNMVKDSIPHEEAEKRAMKVKLLEKYQNECVSHISSFINITLKMVYIKCKIWPFSDDLIHQEVRNEAIKAGHSHYTVKALIDTTSNVNFISKSLANKLGRQYGKHYKNKRVINSLGTIDCLYLSLRYKRKDRLVSGSDNIFNDFEVIKKPCADLVLGLLWLYLRNAKIDIQKEGIKIYGDFVPFCKGPDNSDFEADSSESSLAEEAYMIEEPGNLIQIICHLSS
ncbi:hypothetical protein RclHR1_25780001 [Rhizophagus clarus]|uniref:DNA-directed DNA polymerase n=1 Tax=Rhizophagus clarus TaxID=94130 RepID=A0A2Z6R103_9GLOM|nr:hypothetical protein RclHR1_25780001 [Rhizophagus clarus]